VDDPEEAVDDPEEAADGCGDGETVGVTGCGNGENGCGDGVCSGDRYTAVAPLPRLSSRLVDGDPTAESDSPGLTSES